MLGNADAVQAYPFGFFDDLLGSEAAVRAASDGMYMKVNKHRVPI